jgi:microcystin-dependent protein
MAEPFIGEIKIFAGNFAIRGWAFCDGSLVPVGANPPLFSLIGKTYGGDGQTNFALPDLRGRMAVHPGPGFALGERGGSETVALDQTQLPAHNHLAYGQSANGMQPGPGGGFWASSTLNQYSDGMPTATMNPALIQPAGRSQPHYNMMPFVATSFLIALVGIYPPRS